MSMLATRFKSRWHRFEMGIGFAGCMIHVWYDCLHMSVCVHMSVYEWMNVCVCGSE